ncbi:MAG: M1 family metallopeptidase [Flavobacteriales bacterium]|nr:M1 family metallopeptidase [Flavobacteriales bacterium]
MSKYTPFALFFLFVVPVLTSCKFNTNNSKEVNVDSKLEEVLLAHDAHSFSNPNEVCVTSMHLDLSVDFESKTLKGFVILRLNNKTKTRTLHLDSRQLNIEKIMLNKQTETKFNLTNDVEYFGQDLEVEIEPTTDSIIIYYSTTPQSEALQWLLPEQTSNKKFPFLFSQSQAILARTWIPCQDSPGIKFTYTATIRTDPHLIALMSAKNGIEKKRDGIYHFEMSQPVSSYLMALTVGDLQFQNLGRNCGVFAEPNMLQKCAWELSDMQRMIDSAEILYGKYAWERYDVVVLPPSFPFGGMENPRLTFATPTIIAGDKSLVSLIAHELAHSWSGNLVTNETWNDFWLNEGFTVYFEQRIMEKIYGKDYEEMLTELGMGELLKTLESLKNEGLNEDTHLFLNLDGRNPDDGLTDVAYEKGRFFLQTIEKAVGREKFDSFLKQYFSENAFKPMNTQRFEQYLDKNLLKGDSNLYAQIQPKKWIYGPGLPENAPIIESKELAKVETQIEVFLNGKMPKLAVEGWTTHHWLHFLRGIRGKVSLEQIENLDFQFHLSKSGNSEILCDWFQLCIETQYKKAYPDIEAFLLRVGRRKFLSPIYDALSHNEQDKIWAKKVFEKAKSGYHSVSTNTIEEILKK